MTIGSSSPSARTRRSRAARRSPRPPTDRRAAALVDDEAAVGVAVEREAEVGAVLDDRALQVDEVRRVERVRLVVGEGAVELEVEGHDLERQRGRAGRLAEHRGHREPAHSVAGVDDDLQRADAAEVDERAEVARVVAEDVDALDAAGCRDGVDARRRGSRRPVADRRESGVERDALRTGARELDAVVGGRVVARGEHRRRGVHRAGGEVALVGRAQADRHHVGAARGRRARRRRRSPARSRACRARRRPAPPVAPTSSTNAAPSASTTSSVRPSPTMPRTS